jgi:hypothetical protein
MPQRGTMYSYGGDTLRRARPTGFSRADINPNSSSCRSLSQLGKPLAQYCDEGAICPRVLFN